VICDDAAQRVTARTMHATIIARTYLRVATAPPRTRTFLRGTPRILRGNIFAHAAHAASRKVARRYPLCASLRIVALLHYARYTHRVASWAINDALTANDVALPRVNKQMRVKASSIISSGAAQAGGMVRRRAARATSIVKAVIVATLRKA